MRPLMPASAILLDLKLLQLQPSGNQAVKTMLPGKSAATDFRRALAAIPPVNTGGPKPATVRPVQTLLPRLSAMPVQAVVDNLEVISSRSENSAGTKRPKKALEQQPGAAPSPAAAPQLGVAKSTAAASTFLAEISAPAPAVTAARAPDLSVAQPPLTLAPTATPAPTPVKPDLAKPSINAKQTSPAAPEKAAVRPAISKNIQPNSFALGVANPAHAAHGPAKTAAITRQIAAALPRITSANPGNPPLHIALNPETLGTITIKIAQHASGETTVTLTASQPETLAALKQDAQHLDQVLTNAGIPEANRHVNFQTMPVAATQAGSGLGNTGGQPASGQPAGGLLAGGQFGQGNGNAQQQQAGTAFASSLVRPFAVPAAEPVARPRLSDAGRGVDVIA
jgi:hypothetical protein